MSDADLFTNPRWTAGDLGRALPESIHAVSVALPRWEDVIGYEEKSPAVISRMACGYPRFVIHPLVTEVARRFTSSAHAIPFPSGRVAGMAVAYVRRMTGEATALLGSGSAVAVHAVETTEAGMPALRAFWQHTGLILSTRRAEAVLAGKPSDLVDTAMHRSLREQLAGFYDCAPDDIFLAPTGMAAQFAALSAVMERSPGLPTAQLGFPYVDTLKLQQKFGHGVTLFSRLETVGADLAALLEKGALAACFAEIPGNPTLGSADVRKIKPVLRAKRVPLVVDDVVGTPYNIDLSRDADLIVTSLTKYIAGTGDVMGGAVICNPRSPYYRELKRLLAFRHQPLLWEEDAAVIDAQAHGFPDRMRRHNANGLYLAERLRGHPAMERVWYPKWEFREAYEAVRRPEGGWGSLITFLPKNAKVNGPKIYDALAFCKGPSLGTVFTLACPFTLMAHYTELEWVESCGVPSHLIRISAGLEEPEELWKRLEAALAVV